MFLNLNPPKKKLTPNPDPVRLDVGDCQRAAITWFEMAGKLESESKFEAATQALNKAAMYERMMFDGRK